MTRRVGQVKAREALAGLVGVVSLCALVIVGLDAMLPPGERRPELEAPAEPVEKSCPSSEELDAVVPPLEVSSDALVECPGVYDGRIVIYTGEVVRAVLLRGDRAWVQLNDDPYGLSVGPIPEARTALGGNSGIPVSLPGDVARAIIHVGNHRARGDVIEVRGRFLRADPADDGGPAIQADVATIERHGYPVDHLVNPLRGVIAALMAALAAGTAVLARRARR